MGDATGGGDGDPPDLMSMQTQMDTGTPDTGTVLEKQRAPLLYNAEMKFDWYKLIIQSKSTVGSNASNGNYIRALHLSRVLSETTSKSGDITEIRRLNRNKFLVVCRTAKCANEIIENKKVQEEFNAFIPSLYMQRSAIIRDVDLDIDDKMFMENVDTGNYKILNIRRLNRRSLMDGKVSYIPSRTIKIDFSGQDLPAFIYLWYTKLKCEPYMQRPMQCFSCYKFGHITKNCRSVKLCKSCFQPSGDEHQCDTTTIKCINCKGNHNANSKSCPEFERQKRIKELMSTRNLCFPEASQLVPPVHVTLAIRTRNAFSALENLGEEMGTTYNSQDFPPLKPSKNTTQARTIDKYVPPPLASRTTKRKTVINPGDVTNHNFNEKRKPVPPHFNAAQAISKPESYYSDKEISKMFYKGCEANKMEKQAFSFSNASLTPQSSSMFPSQDSPAVNIPSTSNLYSDKSLRNNKDVVYFKECQRTMSPHMG
ncbi:hypothetical protein M8J75_009871 [Diaphorina citri]|nr:hypothetical protein M8J75_009871 [Diaphorina citri]KAI5728326.1 hypothetical protein M8J77_014744 [Diaphorina citri]